MKLSIVTVNLNNAAGLEKTLISLRKQINNNFELIVIDGASKDNSQNIVNEYRSIISAFISEKDEGIFDAQNKGWKLANGEYVLFLNSGDYLTDNTIIDKFNQIDLNSDLIIGDIIFDLGIVKWRRYYNSKPDDIFLYLESLPHSSTFIKRELLERLNGYDLNYKIVADYDFFIKSIFQYKARLSFLNYPISVFNKMGISSEEIKGGEHLIEREKVFIEYFGKERFEELNRKKIFYNIFYKKIPYIYNFIRSYLSLNVK